MYTLDIFLLVNQGNIKKKKSKINLNSNTETKVTTSNYIIKSVQPSASKRGAQCPQ